jgi:hypothetical protein
MCKQWVTACVLGSTLVACAPSYTYDGAWAYSLEKSIQANKRAIEKSPNAQVSIEVAAQLLGQMEVKHHDFELLLGEQKSDCKVKTARSGDLVVCSQRADPAIKKQFELSLVDGSMVISISEEEKTIYYVFDKVNFK